MQFYKDLFLVTCVKLGRHEAVLNESYLFRIYRQEAEKMEKFREKMNMAINERSLLETFDRSPLTARNLNNKKKQYHKYGLKSLKNEKINSAKSKNKDDFFVILNYSLNK